MIDWEPFVTDPRAFMSEDEERVWWEWWRQRAQDPTLASGIYPKPETKHDKDQT